MVIDTTSREGMESSLAHLMGVSVPELYQYIEAAADSAIEGQWCFNQDLFDKAMEDFYSDMIEQELPDEILFFHLSRRLKGSENEISYILNNCSSICTVAIIRNPQERSPSNISRFDPRFHIHHTSNLNVTGL